VKKMTETKKPYRHGDMLIVPFEGEINLPENKNTTILATGEVSGHKHQIVSGQMILYGQTDSDMILHAQSELEILHDEHRMGTIAEGLWKVTFQREAKPGVASTGRDAWERVMD
jgi:hypothetical protein